MKKDQDNTADKQWIDEDMEQMLQKKKKRYEGMDLVALLSEIRTTSKDIDNMDAAVRAVGADECLDIEDQKESVDKENSIDSIERKEW